MGPDTMCSEQSRRMAVLHCIRPGETVTPKTARIRVWGYDAVNGTHARTMDDRAARILRDLAAHGSLRDNGNGTFTRRRRRARR